MPKELKHLCYTELVYERINKKMKTNLSKDEIEVFLNKILTATDEAYFIPKGKNIYVTNLQNNLCVTINSYTCRIITVDKLNKTTNVRF